MPTPSSSPGDACDAANAPPVEVQVLRTLGHGRAAQAQLVEATWADGRTKTCVEKVFSPGLLTRFIYRASFQAPFAYQSNRDAILACFYRRRVAAAVIEASKIDAEIAMPIYVRFEPSCNSWVLAAEWIDGTGIKPAPVYARRLRDWVKRRILGRKVDRPDEGEITQLLQTMRQLEHAFGESGLTGSGWQVAPKAMVSTANLLRVGSRYTVIDLESGIPAFLVPRYLRAGLSHGDLPPFDDLDPHRITDWIEEHEGFLRSRLKSEGLTNLQSDCARLIEHTKGWKDSEVALLRRPWRLFRRGGMTAYQSECIRRWKQDGIIDSTTENACLERPGKARWVWYAGLLPSSLGRGASKFVGNRGYRERVIRFIKDRGFRIDRWRSHCEAKRLDLIDKGRLGDQQSVGRLSVVLHSVMARVFPRSLHRFIADPVYRRTASVWCLMLLFSRRYQSWYGQKCIQSSITRWETSGRIRAEEADGLRSTLHGVEVRSYARGFGMHLVIKALAPLLVPAKLGGLTAFFASGNPWYLLPLFLNQMLRVTAVVCNWWGTRTAGVRHAEALLVSAFPTIGVLAFPLQMYVIRPELSIFLLRDTASKFAQRIPVYGGRDSRTEIAAIKAVDLIVELMQGLASVSSRLLRRRETLDTAEVTLPVFKHKTNFGRWLDRHAIRAIEASDKDPQPSPSFGRRAA